MITDVRLRYGHQWTCRQSQLAPCIETIRESAQHYKARDYNMKFFTKMVSPSFDGRWTSQGWSEICYKLLAASSVPSSKARSTPFVVSFAPFVTMPFVTSSVLCTDDLEETGLNYISASSINDVWNTIIYRSLIETNWFAWGSWCPQGLVFACSCLRASRTTAQGHQKATAQVFAACSITSISRSFHVCPP